MKHSEKIWICNDCRSVFGAPWADSKSRKNRCTVCGSSNIEIQKTIEIKTDYYKRQK